MTFDLPRASAFAALLTVLAGYVLVFRPLEAAVEERYAQLDGARSTLERSLATARRIPSLERDRNALDAQFRHLHVGDRRAVTVDRFLRTLAGVSARDGVAVAGVAAGVRPAFATTAPAAQRPLLEEIPLDITLRGRYADVIQAVRDINASDGAARITLASLGNADRRPGVRPLLSAAFHVALLREPDAATPRTAHPR